MDDSERINNVIQYSDLVEIPDPSANELVTNFLSDNRSDKEKADAYLQRRAKIREAREKVNINDELNELERLWKVIENLTPEEIKSHENAELITEKFGVCWHEKFDSLTDNQINEFITRQNGFERISDLYFSMYRSRYPKNTIWMDYLMKSLAILAKRAPELAAQQAANGKFLENAAGALDEMLVQRDLFFSMARNGPIGTEGYAKDEPYMHYVWYAKMSDDLKNTELLKKCYPDGVQQKEAPVVDGKSQLYIYNRGGLDFAEAIASIGSVEGNPAVADRLDELKVLQRLFLYATHPSPINGHVSLSAKMLEALADISEKNPQMFDDFIDVEEHMLGQTPREFFQANAGEFEDMPFLKITDPKRRNEYQRACRRLVATFSEGQ